MSATGAEFTRTFLFFGIEPSDGRPCGDFPAEHKADATWAWNFLMGNTFFYIYDLAIPFVQEP